MVTKLEGWGLLLTTWCRHKSTHVLQWWQCRPGPGSTKAPCQEMLLTVSNPGQQLLTAGWLERSIPWVREIGNTTRGWFLIAWLWLRFSLEYQTSFGCPSCSSPLIWNCYLLYVMITSLVTAIHKEYLCQNFWFYHYSTYLISDSYLD